MTMRSLLIIVLFLALGVDEAAACSCASRGSFVDYANGSEGVIRARIADHGKKLSHGETLHASMTVEIIAVLKGDIRLKSVVLLGDPGFMCRDYVDSRIFSIGKEFLIALHGNEAEQPFGGCGEAWLELEGDIAKGYKWTNGESLPYYLELDDLSKRLKVD